MGGLGVGGEPGVGGGLSLGELVFGGRVGLGGQDFSLGERGSVGDDFGGRVWCVLDVGDCGLVGRLASLGARTHGSLASARLGGGRVLAGRLFSQNSAPVVVRPRSVPRAFRTYLVGNRRKISKTMAKQKTAFFVKALLALTACVMALLTVRVIDLQGFRGEFFRIISDQNRRFRVSLPAERGVFLDRYGEPLVWNVRQYFRLENPRALYSPTQPLSASEALQAQVEDPLSVGYSLRREYRWPFSLAHTLGYVSVVSPEDLARDATMGLNDVVGRQGLEQQYDSVLRGQAGYQEFEVNALGEKQAIQTTQAPVPGRSLSTTLDPYLSTVAWRAMGEKMGAVVILNAETGEALSLVSTPGYDGNMFSAGSGEENDQRVALLQQSFTDERKVFFNRVASGTYAPGSIFKLVTAVAGLEKGAFDTSTTVTDEGVLTVGEQQFANWYYTQYGRAEGEISLVRAIARSNDIFFYRAAEWTGIDFLAEKAREFGFGEQTGLEIPGERTGIVPDPAWKERVIGERWFLGNTYHVGIGQGDVLVTPLQLARMVAVFGNGGRVCPVSVLGEKDSKGNQCSDLGIHGETLAAVQEGMIGACSPGGTAFPFFDWNGARMAQLPGGLSSGLSPAEQIRQGVVACKTGTAEFGGEDERGYRKTHAWFGMTVGGLRAMIGAGEGAGAGEGEGASTAESDGAEATGSAMVRSESSRDLALLREQWLEELQKNNFPDEIVILVLVESDESQPYMEGSRDAAPVARSIFDWILGE